MMERTRMRRFDVSGNSAECQQNIFLSFSLQHAEDDRGGQQRRVLQRFVHAKPGGTLLCVGLCQSSTCEGTKPRARQHINIYLKNNLGLI